MSYATLNVQQSDTTFTARITACAMTEAWNNPAVTDTAYATALKRSSSNAAMVFWPVSVATQDAYAYAIANGNPDPGGDESVVSDADILAATQASWPPDDAVPADA